MRQPKACLMSISSSGVLSATVTAPMRSLSRAQTAEAGVAGIAFRSTNNSAEVVALGAPFCSPCRWSAATAPAK